MPVVPRPEDCIDEESNYIRVIRDPKSHPKAVEFFQERLAVSLHTFSPDIALELDVLRNARAVLFPSNRLRFITLTRRGWSGICTG